MPRKKVESKPQEKAPTRAKRTYISQTDVPINSIEEALRVARSIVENYPGGPATPLQVASAMNMSPSSGTFRNLCGSSIAYGLTSGGYNAKEIAAEALAQRIIEPQEEDDDLAAKREAVLKPRILGEFIRKYQNASLPRHDIALNVLVSMGVPRERAESVYTLILDSAQSVGFIRKIKGKQYIDLTGVPPSATEGEELQAPVETPAPIQVDKVLPKDGLSSAPRPAGARSPVADPHSARRVFITHGKNKAFIEPIKRLLGFGELIPLVSVDRQTVAKPVPEKVMDDMRTCGAALIHVETEQMLLDKNANEHPIVNPNVLIEIGAAMALYGRRFILLVQEGTVLPSNLQGLYEVRYEGDSLDGDATIRLLEAINDMKSNPVPDRYSGKDAAGRQEH